MSLIELGKGVMLKGKDNLKYICASEKKEMFNRKFSFNCSCLIGKRYGSAFQIKHNGDLEAIDPVLVEEEEDFCATISPECLEDSNERKDNRNIEDTSDAQNQKLNREDIMSLEKEGVSGTEIIQELVENSSTFHERTEFSKAKYVTKKKKKYIPQFIVLKPTTRLLSQMYYFKNPGKILEVRPDTLAQILTWSNIQSGSNILVFENCQGLICGAALERLGSDGRLIQLYTSVFPVRIIMEQFNFPVTYFEDKVCSLSIDKVGLLEKSFELGKSDDEIIEIMLGKRAFEASGRDEVNVVGENETSVEEIPKITPQGRKRKFEKNKKCRGKQELDVAFISKEQRLKESRNALSHIRAKNIDSLIIVSKYHPKNVLLTLLKLLPSSCPFVIYFPFKEPLMECIITLRELKIGAYMEITESWFRNIQVLPNRTHPQNVMSGSGGYILRGVKVDP